MAEVAKKMNLVATIRTYEKDGEKKKVYKTIGEVTTFRADDGSTFSKAELYHMPGVEISLFEQKEREQQSESTPF